METSQPSGYAAAIKEICDLNWSRLPQDDLLSVAWVYHYFSIQFRENLEIACALHPHDPKLRQLEQEECGTSNLSPWPGVARTDEKLNHDEFMRRLLALSSIDSERRRRLEDIGQSYLVEIRGMDRAIRASSIASYEDGGLESVFRAMLRSPYWDNPSLQAFRHFLVEHIRFDNDTDQGHGALSRHLVYDDDILPLWNAFKRILIEAAPSLGRGGL
ncbi:MAG TPA: hypothetical protein VIG49_12275 [Acetobacteraceae bacterium]